jgi:HK97 family phage major capsid protein
MTKPHLRRNWRSGCAPNFTPKEIEMADEKTVDQLVDEVKTLVEKKHDEVKAIATDALGKINAGEALTEAAKEIADQALIGMNEAKARLDELEQRVAQRREAETAEFKSVGERFTEDEGVKAFMASGSKGRIGMDIESKAIISALTTNAAGSVGGAIVPQRIPGVHGVANRPLRVRDLLTPGQTSSNSIQFVQETALTNAAASVSETAGTTKAQSDLQFSLQTSNVTTLAHCVQATRQILDDVPQLQSYIDGRLMYGLKYVEDNQLLNGAGTGTDLNGIYTQATASTANLAIVATPTKLDVLRAAMLQATLANLPASGIVLHPTDWFGIEVTKDTAGGYVIGNPQDNTEDARVEISTEDGNNFVKNLVTILCEERLALAVYNTLAFVKGDFAAQITDLTS